MADSIPFAMQEDKESQLPTNSSKYPQQSIDKNQLSVAEKAALFDQLTEQADLIVVILDEQGLIRYYNQPALDFWGDRLPRLQNQRNPFIEILTPAQQALVTDSLGQLQYRKSHEIELGMKSVDGQMHWMRLRSRKSPAGSGMILTFEDTTAYREAIESLHAREKLIESVFEAVPVGIGLLNTEGKLEDFNPRFSEIFGYSHTELKTKQFFDLFPEVQKELMQHLHKEFMEMGSDIPAEWEATNSKGETIHIDLHSTLLEKPDGKRFRVVAIKDITRVYQLDLEKKRFDLQKLLLKEISEIFADSSSLDSALDRTLHLMVKFGEFDMAEFWTLDYDQHTLRLKAYSDNPQVGPHFYDDPSQIRQVKISEGMPGMAWEQRVTLTWNRITEHPQFLRKEAAALAEIQSMMALPLFHAAQFMGVLMFGSRNSTESLERYKTLFEELQPLLAAEIRRKQSEDLFSRFFNDSPEMLCLIDLDANFKMLNSAFTHVLGWTMNELKATPALDLVHPDDQEAMIAGYQRVLNGEESVSIECRYRTQHGQYKWILWSASQLRGETGTIFGYGKDITEKKKLEELLFSATEMARIGSWELDLTQPEQDRMYWSPMVLEILGLPLDYAPGFAQILNYYVPESRERIRAAAKRLIEDGVEFDEELLLTTIDGYPRWVRCIGKGEFYGGRCIRIYGSLQDIHAAKTLELRISTILESIGDAFIAIDKYWNVTYWNRLAENILNHKREEVLGREFWHFFHDQQVENFHHRCQQVMNGQEKQSLEAYFPRLQKWLEINLYPSETGLSLYIKDISQRRKAEMDIRESNERFQLVAQATNDAIWDWDFPNETLLWGEGYTNLFGHPLHKDDMTPEFWSKRIHPEDKERVLQSLEAAIGNPDISRWREEYRYLKSDGTYAFVVDRGGLMRDAKGRAIRMVGTVSDLTYRKQYEESLRELNEALDKRARELALSNAELEQFAYVASHDLQEPLRMVTGFISRLDTQYGDGLDERARQYMRFAVDGAKRMRQLILDLLAFSRAGRQSEAKSYFSVNEIIHGVCELQKSLISDKNAEIVVETMPVVNSYRTAFRQIFQNLISNALKYSKPDQPVRVEISCKEQDSEWIFAVKDNGIGIHPEYFEKVFVIFQRLHQQDNFGGTGIGLAIVKKQVENLGGRIWVESEEGQGTCFYFSLPREIDHA
jgi:PAS domain S-box-containing protein